MAVYRRRTLYLDRLRGAPAFTPLTDQLQRLHGVYVSKMKATVTVAGRSQFERDCIMRRPLASAPGCSELHTTRSCAQLQTWQAHKRQDATWRQIDRLRPSQAAAQVSNTQGMCRNARAHLCQQQQQQGVGVVLIEGRQ